MGLNRYSTRKPQLMMGCSASLARITLNSPGSTRHVKSRPKVRMLLGPMEKVTRRVSPGLSGTLPKAHSAMRGLTTEAKQSQMYN